MTLGPPVLAGAGAGAGVAGVPVLAAAGAGAAGAGVAAAGAGAGAAAAGAWAAGVGATAAGACWTGAAGAWRVVVRCTRRTGDERADCCGALAVAGAIGAALATGVAVPVEGADPPPPDVCFAAGATRCVRTMFGAADRPIGAEELPVAAAAVVPEPAEPDADSSLSRPCVTTVSYTHLTLPTN